MSGVRVQVIVPADVLEDLKLRCKLKGRDFRIVAGGFIQDALEGGFYFDTDEEETQYHTLRAQAQAARADQRRAAILRRQLRDVARLRQVPLEELERMVAALPTVQAEAGEGQGEGQGEGA